MIFPFSVSFSLVCDSISLWLILLTIFLMPLCVAVSWNGVKYRLREYLILLLFIEFLLLVFFLVDDLFFFFIFYESVLIPMFLLITIWGSRVRKIHAGYQFFFFTVCGSIFMLIVIAWITGELGFTNMGLLKIFFNQLENKTYFGLSKSTEGANLFLRLVWLGFFFGFCVKVPMYPFHIWLPEAHVEASTAGSVILAGILLKMGIYGMYKTIWSFLPVTTYYFLPLIVSMSLLGILYTALATIRQNDLKKIIAYSSVGHMGFCTLGLVTYNTNAISGALYLMISHGLISSLLFICIGLLYDRYKTRLVGYYGGIVNFMPIFSVSLFFATIANMSFPTTSGFIGELLVLLGVFEQNPTVAFLATLGIIFSGVYAIWLFNRVCFGRINFRLIAQYGFYDLSFRETLIVANLIFTIFLFGICPNIILSSFEYQVNAFVIESYKSSVFNLLNTSSFEDIAFNLVILNDFIKNIEILSWI
jgi:proton-translocating NADH-quinone oxidoreductase chain M